MNKILLIGNGGSLLKRRLGVFIDEFDGEVARFNDFEIKGYEQYIGTRTDLWIISEKYKNKERLDINKLVIPEKFTQKLRKKSFTASPTLGARAAQWFIEKDYEVWIIGIDHFQGELSHYFGSCITSIMDHSAQEDKAFFDRLILEGKVKRFCEYSDPVMTVIIPFYDEGDEPYKTVMSCIENTPKNAIKFILIDDHSTKYRDAKFDNIPNLKYYRNKQIMGVDYCRTLGGYMADTPYLLLVDAHMRFNPGWFDRYIFVLRLNSEAIVYCKTDYVTDYPDNENIRKPTGVQRYFADLKLERNGEVLSSKWTNDEPPEIFTEVTGLMGANYGISKQWFKYIRGMEGLRQYGISEQFLALKNLYFGGKIIYIKDVRIAHLYRYIATFPATKTHFIYNQMFTLRTLLPWKEVKKLEAKIPESKYKEQAKEMIKRNNGIELLRKDFTKKKVMSFEKLVKTYNL
jgi:hypothetical protein